MATSLTKCFLCQKNVVGPQKVKTVQNKFLQHLKRFAKFETPSKASTNELSFCGNCDELGKSFCDYSFQLEIAQFRRDFIAKEILDAMKTGDKRAQLLKSSQSQSQPFESGLMHEDVSDNDDDDDFPVVLENMEKLRRHLSNCCKKRLQPKPLIGTADTDTLAITRSSFKGNANRKLYVNPQPGHSRTPQIFSKQEYYFPDIVLEVIFTKLIEADKAAIMNARLVNLRWKQIMDSVLEKECINHWRKWELKKNGDYSKVGFPSLPLVKIGRGPDMPLLWGECPEFICGRNVDDLTNPFPTKSLCISWEHTSSLQDLYWDIMNLVCRHGHHLTSLTFKKISMQPEQIRAVLKNTPNLKAISFDNVTLNRKRDEKIIKVFKWEPLPLVKSLEYLKIIDVNYSPIQNVFDHEDNLYDWLLHPFIKQLVSLEIDHKYKLIGYQSPDPAYGYTCWNRRKENVVFSKLKQLKIRRPENEFFELTHSFPTLQRLHLVDFRDNLDFDKLNGFLERFRGTLEELFLDLGFEEITKNSSPPPPSMFKEIKKFAMFVPKDEIQVDIINNHFLKRFPNLESLTLVHWEVKNGLKKIGTKEIMKMRKFIEKTLVLDDCKKLKRVTGLDRWREELFVSSEKQVNETEIQANQ